jgi:hypothetical protein
VWKSAAPEAAAAAVKKTITEPENAKDGSMREGGQRLASGGLWRRADGSGGGDGVVEVASTMAMAAALVVVVVAVVAMPRSSRGSPLDRRICGATMWSAPRTSSSHLGRDVRAPPTPSSTYFLRCTP